MSPATSSKKGSMRVLGEHFHDFIKVSCLRAKNVRGKVDQLKLPTSFSSTRTVSTTGSETFLHTSRHRGLGSR